MDGEWQDSGREKGWPLGGVWPEEGGLTLCLLDEVSRISEPIFVISCCSQTKE